MLKRAVFIVIIFCFFECNLPAGETELISEIELTHRIQEIQSCLDAGKTRAQLWWYGWTGFYSGAAIFSFTLAALSNDTTPKIFQNVQAVESLVGAGGLLILPFPSRYASQKLKAMPENSLEEKTAKLKEAEILLERSAKAESAGRSLLQHTLAFLVNASGSAVIYFGYGKKIKENGDNPFSQALMNFVSGTAVAELQIWTQPTRAIKDWKKYEKEYIAYTFPLENGIAFGIQFRF